MPPFPKPTGAYDYDVEHELKALREYSSLPDRADRAIPPKRAGQLLMATWNIANLGVQDRRPKDYRLIAQIISWFDLVALQEVNDNLRGLRAIQAELPPQYAALFNDAGGNNERFAFLYDKTKVQVLEEIGEVTVAASELPRIKVPGVHARFAGFDRNPMLATFQVEGLRFALADVHLYFGSERPAGKPDDEATPPAPAPAQGTRAAELPAAAGMDRRVLEAAAIAYWANKRSQNETSFVADAVALGDFNLPVNAPGDRVFDALTQTGLKLPPHSTHVIGSNLNDDAHYDQMAIVPGKLNDAIQQVGIFDYDGAVFRDLWANGNATAQKKFRAYVRYYLSDHRPLWIAVAT